MNPAAAKSNTPVPRAIEQVIAEQGPQVIQDGWGAGGVQTVTAVVDGDAGQRKAPGVAANVGGALEHDHRGLVVGAQLPGGADTGGACTQDDNPRATHGDQRAFGGMLIGTPLVWTGGPPLAFSGMVSLPQLPM